MNEWNYFKHYKWKKGQTVSKDCIKSYWAQVKPRRLFEAMFGAIVEYARCNLMLYQDIQQSSRRIIKSLGCVDSSWNKFPSHSFHVATRLPDVKLYNGLFTHKGPGGWILVFSTCVILHGRLGKSAPGWGVCVCVNPSSSLAQGMAPIIVCCDANSAACNFNAGGARGLSETGTNEGLHSFLWYESGTPFSRTCWLTCDHLFFFEAVTVSGINRLMKLLFLHTMKDFTQVDLTSNLASLDLTCEFTTRPVCVCVCVQCA